VHGALWLSFLFIAGWTSTLRLRSLEADAARDGESLEGSSHTVGVGPFRVARLGAPRFGIAPAIRNAIWAALTTATFVGTASLWQLVASIHAVMGEQRSSVLMPARSAPHANALAENVPAAITAVVALALAVALHRVTLRRAQRALSSGRG
jgi:hypothetical protein